MNYLEAYAVWVILVFLAIINGILRNTYFTPKVGEQKAHVLSSFTLSFVIVAVTYIYIGGWRMEYTGKELTELGVLWTLSTIAFEFVFGHYVAKHSWEKLLADYDLRKGRIWLLVLATTFAAPHMAKYLLAY